MQIQIMTHGEAFCPSTMNQVRMIVINIMRTEMQKCPTEENEIKEGQEKVEEELGNETKESTFSSPWKFCRNLLNEERGQMNENKIKEGQEEEQEDQGNKLVMYRRRAVLCFRVWNVVIDVGQKDVFKKNDRQKMFRKGRNKRDQLKIVKESTCIRDILELGNHGIRQFDEPFWIKKNGRTNVDGLFENWFRTEERRHVVAQDDAQKEREKIIDNHEELISGLDDAEKGFGQTSGFLRSREFYEEQRRIKTKLQEILYKTFKLEDGRHVIVQGYAQKERGKLIDNSEELSGELDDAEKGFGQTSGFLRSREFYEEERRIKTKLEEMLDNWFKLEERRHVVVQGDAQKERGKLIDNSEELSGELDDAEKEIQELEQLLRCKVCLDCDACIVFFPCRHMVTCEYCEGFLPSCPVCRSVIEEAVKINEE